ncbi:hypothetical protein [Pseudorhodobacter wandonensis]|uniref:hypothetical protein n=1 Tax=Pseudorhodobacter wandonensis TaxID=1120568 RepID=UPI0012E15AFD|nr:hypothetical protein [Pseudorhodobacter wandonensis]
MAVRAEQDQIDQLGRLARGERRNKLGVTTFDKAVSALAIGGLEVEAACLAAQVPMLL